MAHKPRSRYQRMQLAMSLAQAIERQTTNGDLNEMAVAIQLVLGAPAELLSCERIARVEAILHENSGNCCFKQRGYNWNFEQGSWSVRACTVCKKFTNWADALQAAMSDEQFRELKPRMPAKADEPRRCGTAATSNDMGSKRQVYGFCRNEDDA